MREATLLDLVGAGLFAGAVAWMTLASSASGGSAAPGIQLLVACGLVIVIVKMIGVQGRVVVPAAVLLIAVVIAAQSKTSILSTAPLSGPLEYINADGAFYAQAAIAGLMLAAATTSWPLRLVGGAGAGFFAVLPFAIHAEAAAWLVVILPAAALLAAVTRGGKGARAAVVFCGALLIGSMALTIALGAGYRPGSQPNTVQRAAIRAVDENRLELWHDAFTIMQNHPGVGVGAGRYQVVSPIASQDPDYRWAHNEFLQQGAEGGVTGLLLLALIFVWGVLRLWVVRSPDAVTALGAAALAALGIHATIDYVIHFPAIPIVAASLVAVGMIERETGPLRPESARVSAGWK
ncbi:MAG: O-antigen ligase family protein [Actinomycetota bacterium]